jgi:hypothetical protein
VGRQRLEQGITDRTRGGALDELGDHAEAAVVVDAGDDRQRDPVRQTHPAHDVDLPQLHRTGSLPALVVVAPTSTRLGRDQAVTHEAAIDGGARRWRLELAPELVEDGAGTPSRMAAAQLDDAGLDLRCHLVWAPIRPRALVGERGEAVGGIADEPAVKGAAVDAVAGRGALDRGSIEHLSDRVVALLNHRKIHQWHGVLLGSAEHK